MTRTRNVVDVPALGAIDKRHGQVTDQLIRLLRDAIRRGELKPGERLPSTRALADSLRLARGTVSDAFGQLTAEGFLKSKIGVGTLVAAAWPNRHWHDPAFAAAHGMTGTTDIMPLPEAAARYAAIARALSPLPPVPFAVAVPNGDAALDDAWRRVDKRVRASPRAAPASYDHPAGVPALREAVADYVRQSRAVTCSADNVVILNGTQQGLYIAARVFLAPGAVAWTENPAYPGLTSVLEDAAADIYRVPVDEHGMNLPYALATFPKPRAVFVTPSHQYPLGMPLSMARRAALLAWAREQGTWIVEDDYDSELRYAGHPFPSMQGLDPARTVYLGTFSKVLAPSLRLGYAIVPDCLVDVFAGAKALIDRHANVTDQHVIAAFINEGYFDAHIRRIRGVYADRRAVLLAELGRRLPTLPVQEYGQGMHIVLWLPPGIDDVAFAAAAMTATSPLSLRAISPMYAAADARSGVMLGFGGYSSAQIIAGVGTLAELLRTAQSGSI